MRAREIELLKEQEGVLVDFLSKEEEVKRLKTKVSPKRGRVDALGPKTPGNTRSRVTVAFVIVELNKCLLMLCVLTQFCY